MKVLAIGAHFDDVELGCGGTLLNHLKKGDELNIIIITKSGYISKVNMHERNDKIAYEEGIKSAKLLNANLIRGDFETLKLTASLELVNYLCEQVKQINPDIVYTHFWGDQHLDHQAVAKASLIATRNTKRVLAYLSNVYDTIPDFKPNYFVNISNSFKGKMSLINCFKSELVTHPQWQKQMKAISQIYGIKIGKEFAEAFQVVRIIEEE